MLRPSPFLSHGVRGASFLVWVSLFCLVSGCGGGDASLSSPATRLKLAVVWPEYSRSTGSAELVAPYQARSMQVTFSDANPANAFTETVNRPDDLTQGTLVATGRQCVHRLTHRIDLATTPVNEKGQRIRVGEISLTFFSGSNGSGSVVGLVSPTSITVRPAAQEPNESNTGGARTHSFPRDLNGNVVSFALVGKVTEVVFPSAPQILSAGVLSDLKFQLRTEDGSLIAAAPGSVAITPTDPQALKVISGTLSNAPSEASRPLLVGSAVGTTSVSVSLHSVQEVNLDGTVKTPGITVSGTGTIFISPSPTISIAGDLSTAIVGATRNLTATVNNLESTGQSGDVVFSLKRDGVLVTDSLHVVNGRTMAFTPTVPGTYTVIATSVLKTASGAPITASGDVVVLGPLSFDLTAPQNVIPASATDASGAFPPVVPSSLTVTAVRNWLPVEGGIRWTIDENASLPKNQPLGDFAGYFSDVNGPVAELVSPPGTGPKSVTFVAPSRPRTVTIRATSLVDPSATKTLKVSVTTTSVGVTLN